MRHINFYKNRGTFTGKNGRFIYEPYPSGKSGHYKYARPSKDRVYIRLLQFIADHPLLNRKEIVANVFLDKEWLDEHDRKIRPNSNRAEQWENGDFSWVTYAPTRIFAEMLWADLIDYDHKFKYTIREKGIELLKASYVNDGIKNITGKYPWEK